MKNINFKSLIIKLKEIMNGYFLKIADYIEIWLIWSERHWFERDIFLNKLIKQ